jgi:hypothetical protein
MLLSALLAAAGVAQHLGNSGRRMLPTLEVERVRAPEEALAAWRRHGVRGRVLVHFARHVAMSAERGPASPQTYLLRALEEGVIRRVYHVIPDDAWPEVDAVLASRDGVERGTGGSFRLQKAGAPIVVISRSGLPPLPEPALVTVEADRWSPDALASIVARLRQGSPKSDLVLWWGADERAPMMEALGHAAP